MQNNEKDGFSSPSHAFVKANHCESLLILQFLLSCATSNLQLPGMKIIMCFVLHPVAGVMLNTPPKIVTFSSSVSLCVVTTLLHGFTEEKKKLLKPFHSEFVTIVIVVRLTED